MDMNETTESILPVIESIGGSIGSPLITLFVIFGGGVILYQVLKVLTQNDKKTVLRKQEHTQNKQQYEKTVSDNTEKIKEFRREVGELVKEVENNKEQADSTKRVINNIVEETVNNIENNDDKSIEESKRRIQEVINRMKK